MYNYVQYVYIYIWTVVSVFKIYFPCNCHDDLTKQAQNGLPIGCY